MPDPIVTVGHPTEAHWETDEPVVMEDLLLVTCSSCGDVTDATSLDQRVTLQHVARKHAASEHDGLVDAVGWVR